MKPPVVDLHAANTGPMSVVRLPESVHAAQWKLQLQRAGESLRRPEPPPHGEHARQDDERHDLESCGAPAVTGEPAAQRAHATASRAAPAEEPLPPREGTEREAERSPVRLHVQAAPGDGLKVWLGIDGNAALVVQRAGVAVADLRRNLQSTGDRIGAVVCNGVPLDPLALTSALPARTPSPFLKDSP